MARTPHGYQVAFVGEKVTSGWLKSGKTSTLAIVCDQPNLRRTLRVSGLDAIFAA